MSGTVVHAVESVSLCGPCRFLRVAFDMAGAHLIAANLQVAERGTRMG